MRITRRAFGQWLLGFMALPALPLQEQQKPPQVPDTVAGHRLSGEERELAAKFLATHEKHIGPLRERALPNDLPPDFRFSSPSMKEVDSKP